MKKLHSLMIFLLTAMLAVPMATAEAYHTVSEVRAQAAAGWQKQYQVSGRSIAVDVAPLVPDVQALPLVAVGRRMADISLPADASGWRIDRNGLTDFMIGYGQDAQEEPAGYVYVDGNRLTAKPYRVTYDRAYAPDSALMPGNPLPFGEIVSIMEKVLPTAGLAPDTIDIAHPYVVQTHAYYGKTDTEFLSHGWGSFTWDILLRGVPCHGPFTAPFTQGSDQPEIWTPSMSLTIRRPDLFWVSGSPVAEKETLADDLPLIAFDRVVEGYEREIMAGRVRHVFDLSLGYVLMPRPGMTHEEAYRSAEGTYYAKPYWRLECLWGENAKAPHKAAETEGNGPYPDPRNSVSHMSLLMDAQTGEILDPTDSSHGRAEYKGFLRWEDAGGRR